MDNYIKIKISEDFTINPGARYRKDGPFSGQEFYEDILKGKFQEALDNKKKVFIDLDGTWGYASSFISEVFRRLKQEFGIRVNIKDYLFFKSEDEPGMIDKIMQVIDETEIH